MELGKKLPTPTTLFPPWKGKALVGIRVGNDCCTITKPYRQHRQTFHH